MTKPTEGPYRLASHQILRGNCDKTHLWRIASVNKAFPNWQANARLLAKSWEMQEALDRIANLSAGGPHIDAKDGMSSALAALDRARDIARALLASIDGDKP